MRDGSGWLLGAAALAGAAWCSPARAWTAEVGWPTFYRTGPDRHYAVLEDVSRGVRLEVLSCDNGWCRVQNERSVGYVEQEALVTPAAMPLKPAALPNPADCFLSHETGYGKGETYLYCPRPAG